MIAALIIRLTVVWLFDFGISQHSCEVYNHFAKRWRSSSPRNNGIQAADYDYVMFFDAGDDVLDLRMAKQVNIARSKGFSLVGFGRRRTNDVDQSIRWISGLAIIILNPITLSGSLVSKSFITKHGLSFCEDRCLVGVEDYDLWIRITKARRARIGVVSGHYIAYTRSAGGLSAALFKRIVPHWRVLERNFAFPVSALFFILQISVGAFGRMVQR